MKESNREKIRRKNEEEDEDGRRRKIIMQSTIGRRINEQKTNKQFAEGGSQEKSEA